MSSLVVARYGFSQPRFVASDNQEFPALAEHSFMALFDTVFCRYPLPHHQGARFRTLDLHRVVFDDADDEGPMRTYEITVDGLLRRVVQEHPGALKTLRPRGRVRSVERRWENLIDAHGDMVIYTFDDVPGRKGRPPTEFGIRFTNGRVEHVMDMTPPPSRTVRGGGDAVAVRRTFRLIHCPTALVNHCNGR